MDLLKYLEPMKHIPERFSNLAFWRGVRKLRDDVVNALEYVDSWGEHVESIINKPSIATQAPVPMACIRPYPEMVLKLVKYDYGYILSVFMHPTAQFTATLDSARQIKYGFISVTCEFSNAKGDSADRFNIQLPIPATLYSPSPNKVIAIPTVNCAQSYELIGKPVTESTNFRVLKVDIDCYLN